MPPPPIRTATTDELDPPTIAEIRALLERVFDEPVTDDDWSNCLGGVHLLIEADDQIVAYCALVERELTHDGRAFRCGYVEALAVDAGRRGSGYGARLMDEVERRIRDGYEIGALSSSAAALSFYPARGWVPWQGQTAVQLSDGVERTPDDDDSVFVLPVTAELDRTGLIVCDWRPGDVW